MYKLAEIVTSHAIDYNYIEVRRNDCIIDRIPVYSRLTKWNVGELYDPIKDIQDSIIEDFAITVKYIEADANKSLNYLTDKELKELKFYYNHSLQKSPKNNGTNLCYAYRFGEVYNELIPTVEFICFGVNQRIFKDTLSSDYIEEYYPDCPKFWLAYFSKWKKNCKEFLKIRAEHEDWHWLN